MCDLARQRIRHDALRNITFRAMGKCIQNLAARHHLVAGFSLPTNRLNGHRNHPPRIVRIE